MNATDFELPDLMLPHVKQQRYFFVWLGDVAIEVAEYVEDGHLPYWKILRTGEIEQETAVYLATPLRPLAGEVFPTTIDLAKVAINSLGAYKEHIDKQLGELAVFQKGEYGGDT